MPGVENTVGYLSSGTSIEPKTTSESSAMIHRSLGSLVDIQQNGPRGANKLFSTNWLMPAFYRQFGKQSLSVRTMLSLEPATITKRRYPLLFQTGETAYGLSIVDGQHPHNFFMELAARYDFKLSERSQLFVYGGPVGDAALGPTAFPHRASSSENPLAPIGHHMQDATHIASDVITVGGVEGPVQLEVSAFQGREPGENRWSIRGGKPDSFSGRITLAPYKTVSAQFSTGRIKNPEALDPALDTMRMTASIHHDLQLSSGHLSSSLIWGRNEDLKNGARRIFNSYNLEITSKFLRRNWVWTRIENVDRDRSLLPVETQTGPVCRLCGVVGFGTSLEDTAESRQSLHRILGPNGVPVTIEEEPIGRIQAYTVGYERTLAFPAVPSWMSSGIGLQVTMYSLPPHLVKIYGTHPATVAMFLRLRPTGNMSEHMKSMHHQ